MDKKNSSYKQIVKSTGIFGGVQVINTIIGIVRNKLGAILLGPDGIGIISIYQNIVDLIRSVSSLGINTGAVRDIASSEDKGRQVYVISVFRWWVTLTSCLGCLICLVFCYPISLWAFDGNSNYTLPVALLSVAVFFLTLSAGQSTILQGLRMISLMAKASLLGNVAGLIISIVFYCLLGLKGIVPAFVLSGIILFFFTNSYVRKIQIPKITIEHSIALEKGISNLKLGLYIVSVSILNTASMFLVRSFLVQTLDLTSVGIFSAVWTLTTTYPALILNSMGSDFFPRLCSVSNSNTNTKKLVNEQTYIALVTIIPIMLVMILFSKYILYFFYSSQFMVAESLLQWQIIGGFFKVLSWPLAFIMLAKGKGAYHLLAEIVFYVIYLGCSYFLFPYYGLFAFGMGYLLAYVAYLFVVFFVGIKLCSFGWNKQNIRLSVVGIVVIVLAIAIQLYVEQYQWFISLLLCLITVVYAIVMFNKVFDIRELIDKLRKKISNRD